MLSFLLSPCWLVAHARLTLKWVNWRKLRHRSDPTRRYFLRVVDVTSRSAQISTASATWAVSLWLVWVWHNFPSPQWGQRSRKRYILKTFLKRRPDGHRLLPAWFSCLGLQRMHCKKRTIYVGCSWLATRMFACWEHLCQHTVFSRVHVLSPLRVSSKGSHQTIDLPYRTRFQHRQT